MTCKQKDCRSAVATRAALSAASSPTPFGTVPTRLCARNDNVQRVINAERKMTCEMETTMCARAGYLHFSVGLAFFGRRIRRIASNAALSIIPPLLTP